MPKCFLQCCFNLGHNLLLDVTKHTGKLCVIVNEDRREHLNLGHKRLPYVANDGKQE